MLITFYYFYPTLLGTEELKYSLLVEIKLYTRQTGKTIHGKMTEPRV